MNTLDLSFYSSLKNEDANPYVGRGVVAVADGLGGSGSAVHVLRPGQNETLRRILYHTVIPAGFRRDDARLNDYFGKLFAPMTDARPDTSALWASRIVMARFVCAVNGGTGAPADPADPQARRRLAAFMEDGLRAVADGLGLEKGKLGSQLLLPTTFAAVFLREGGEGFVTAETVWAGDSRCYALTGEGLKLLSRDDEDATGAITNLFRVGEGSAVLHYRRCRLQAPCAVFACSDGVFDPYAGHEHLCVEHVLLREMERGSSAGELCRRLCEHYARIRGDDATMAFKAAGFASYAAMKRFFAPRAAAVARMYESLAHFRPRLEVAQYSEDDVTGYVRSRTSDKFEAVVAAACEALREGKADPVCVPSVCRAYEAAYARRKAEAEDARRLRRGRLIDAFCARFEAEPAAAHLFFARSKKLGSSGKKCKRDAGRVIGLANALVAAQKEFSAKEASLGRARGDYAAEKAAVRERAVRHCAAYRALCDDPKRRAECLRAYEAFRYIAETLDFGKEPEGVAPRAEDVRAVQSALKKREEWSATRAALAEAEKKVKKAAEAYGGAVRRFLEKYAEKVDADPAALFGPEMLKIAAGDDVPREPSARAVLQDVLAALLPAKEETVGEIVRALAAASSRPSAADALYNGTRLSAFRLFFATKGETGGAFEAFCRDLAAFEEAYESLFRAPAPPAAPAREDPAEAKFSAAAQVPERAAAPATPAETPADAADPAAQAAVTPAVQAAVTPAAQAAVPGKPWAPGGGPSA